jgi:uncharacterized membrane protein YkoI
MTDRIKGVLAALAAVAALGAGGAAIASATGNDESTALQAQPAATAESESDANENEADRNENDVAIGGSALDKASAAALASTGGGQVTETEVGDEESYYEVEVTRDDGSQVDVQLDRDFNVVGSSADGQDG